MKSDTMKYLSQCVFAVCTCIAAVLCTQSYYASVSCQCKCKCCDTAPAPVVQPVKPVKPTGSTGDFR